MLYNVEELIERLNKIKEDGYKEVDLSFIEADEVLPECIHFDVVGGIGLIDYEEVDSVGEIPEDDYEYKCSKGVKRNDSRS